MHLTSVSKMIFPMMVKINPTKITNPGHKMLAQYGDRVRI